MVFNNAQLSDFFNKMNKKITICNAECQRKKRVEKLKTDYINAQNKVQNSKPELNNAEKHYITEKYGHAYYNNILENRAKKEAKGIIAEWNKHIQPIFSDLETKINFNDTQNTYQKNIGYVKTSYSKDLNKLKKNVNDTISEKQVNNRLGEYYSQSTDTINSLIYYFKILYWILVVISMILIIYKKKIMNPTYWPYIFFILSFPSLLNLSYVNIMKVFRHFYIDNIYFVSVIMLGLCLVIFSNISSIPFNTSYLQ